LGRLEPVRVLEKRLEALERSLGSTPEADSEELKRRREEMKASWPRAWERALAEEAAGDPRRRIALEELEESAKRRITAREDGR
jgi:hypothetical protein